MSNTSQHRTAGDDSADRSGHRRPNRRHVLGVAVGSTIGSLAGCLETYDTVAGTADDGDDPVTIGVLATDPDSDHLGRAIPRSARVAVDLLNEEEGGIDGRDVELVVGDTAGSPLEGRREYQRLVLEEGADVTIGVSTTEVLEHVIHDIAEQETLHITAGAATASVTELVHEQYEDYKYHFRAGPVNGYKTGQAQVDFLMEMAPEMGWDSIALLAEDYTWSEDPWATVQDQRADLPVDIAFEERYPPALDDFSELFDDVEATGVDAVFISTAHTGTDAILDWSLEERPFEFGGIHIPMQMPDYYDQIDGACRYGIAQSSAPVGTVINEETERFRAGFQERYDSPAPVYTGYFAYDAVMLFAEAVERGDTLDSDDLVEVLEDVDGLAGSAGTIEFYDRDHEFAHDLVYETGDNLYFQWQEVDGEGSQEVIWPEEHATSEYLEPDWL